ncbi:GerAB/ArcD/ProY family transporter [Paenibacillus montanisoli]|uniref:Spore gernimation protein n=1 Tax=Paenibacillus montanisoli TaxID=2081970 RepID=A0A328U4M0_9BACL|nr:GerAB/ArcD/ProY family transporter [Paenibacillus montanisoli]RAP77012.1 spore gernimation protein [Paenibacillus montanisoli]
MERISQSQLAALIIMFQIGSTPLFLLGKDAGADAWIAVLIAMAAGLLLLLLTLCIHRLEPGKELMEIMNTYFGKYIGYVFGIAYFIYFSYQSVRNLREFGDLTNLYLLPRTPLPVLIGCLLLVAGYAVWHGIEVFGRITQILLPGICAMYGAFLIAIYATGLFDLHRIEPFLDHGVMKVIDAALPEVLLFPFGEMVLFLMFWKFADRKKHTFRTTALSYAGTGCFIILTNLFIAASLGPIAQISVAPFIQLVSQIQFASFVERLDPFVAALLFTGVFIKLTAYFFGAAFIGRHLVKADQRYIVVSVGVILLVGSLWFRSFMQHIWIGFEYNLKYHFPVFQIYLPALILIVMLLRSQLRANGSRRS